MHCSMHSFLTLVTLSALVANAAPLARSSRSGVVSIPITRHRGNDIQALGHLPGIFKQQNVVSESLKNEIVSYTADFEIGNPPQKVQALVDTGSSDLWVFSSQVVNTNDSSYTPGDSSTYKLKKQNGFNIAYVSGSTGGDWATDTVIIGGASLPDQQFAVVNEVTGIDSTISGILGIGLKEGEAVDSPSEVYDNLPYMLKKQGSIERVAYSLYLDNIHADSGTILFGGIDHSKYAGQLSYLPLSSPTHLSLNFSVAGHSTSGYIDSGTSFTYLPPEIIETIKSRLDVQLSWDPNQGAYFATSRPSSMNTLDYTFGNTTVSVPMDELFMERGPDQYLFTIIPIERSLNIVLLGDSTLRSAYLVYDLEGRQIGVAPANFDDSPSKIESITGDPARAAF